MVRLDIPLQPMKHAYIVTESMPQVKGCSNIRDHDYSIYLRVQGESLQLGGYEINPEILKEVFINSFFLIIISINFFSFYRCQKIFILVYTI